MKIFYPYRTKKGGRSILEAIDLDDAREYLRSANNDMVFCEVVMTHEERDEIFALQKTRIISFLKKSLIL